MRPKRIFTLLLAVILALGLVSGSLAQVSSTNPPPDSAFLDRQGGAAGSGQTDAAAPAEYQSIASFSEDFADITNLPGWFAQNNSDPLGLTDWFQGNDTVFPAHAGAPTAYIAANFNNTSGVGTISNWLLTPDQSLKDGDSLSFWTRTTEASLWPDRLQVRLSLAGGSTDVGTGAEDVGDFTTLLLEVNPNLEVGGYPEAWTQYTVTLSGIPAGSSGRLAFRYYVTDGGPSGTNSNYIGIDTVEFFQAPSIPPSIALSKTVGTDRLICAATDEITVVGGSEVTYCYEVENTGEMTLTLHTLEDSELGVLLSDFSYVLVPGASAFLTETATIEATTVNTATWTAFNQLTYIADDTIPYSFEDISATGTAFSLTDDSVSGALPIGFNFNYYRTIYTDVYAASNGFLSVLPGQGSGCCTGQPLPNTSIPNGVIAGWWEDFNPSIGGAFYYQTLGTAPNRRFIVQYSDIPHFGGGNLVTMQFKLFEGSNLVEVHYAAAPSDGGTHSAGIENEDGTQGVQYYLGIDPLTTPLAVRYIPQGINESASASNNATVIALLPEITVEPGVLTSLQSADSIVARTLTIGNTGDPATILEWELIEEQPGVPMVQGTGSPGPSRATQNPPVVTSKEQCQAYENYPGSEPVGYAEFCLEGKPLSAVSGHSPVAPTDQGYAQDIGFVSDNFVNFALNDFPGQSIVGANTDALYGMDFDPSATTLYALNTTTGELGTIDLATGVFTGLVPSVDPDGGIWTGLSIDPVSGIFYASNITKLFTIDPATGAATLVGPFGTNLMIDIAVNTNGEMYGHDIETDSIYSIDTTTGNATLIGATGYAANFAQGMDFDNDDGTLYIFLYVGGGANVYGTVDLSTGAVTPLAVDNPLGEFEGATQTTGGVCMPGDIPWVSVSPITGTLPSGESQLVEVIFDSAGLAKGVYTGNLCINSNDPLNPQVTVPLTMTVADVAFLEVAHLAPFAADPGTAVTVTVDGAPVLTGFEYGDSTGYVTLLAGEHLVEIYPQGSATPAITATVDLITDTYSSAIAVGGANGWSLDLLLLDDDLSAPAAGNFKLRLGHLAPFAAGAGTLADVRLQDGTVILDDVPFGAVAAYLELPEGVYDLKITTPDGSLTLIDPLPVSISAGEIVAAFASGDGANQPLGAFAWPAGVEGFFLPLAIYGVELSPAEAAQSGSPGETVMYSLQVTNTSDVTDTFGVDFNGNAWNASVAGDSFVLAAGESAELEVQVLIPGSAAEGDMDMVTVTVSGMGGQMASSELTTTAVISVRKVFLPVIPQRYTAP